MGSLIAVDFRLRKRNSAVTADDCYTLGCRLEEIAGSNHIALHYYEIGLLLDSKHYGMRVNYGNCLLHLGFPQRAKKQWRLAVKICPDRSDAHYNLGYSEAAMGEYHKAIRHLKRAVKADPTFPDALFNLGYSYHKLGKAKQAKKCLDRFLALSPNDECAPQALAMLSGTTP